MSLPERAQPTTRAITAKDWKDIEKRLENFFEWVRLRCDGYDVSLTLKRISVFQNGIMVYINGVMQYGWLIEDCEERRRFFPASKRQHYSSKQLKEFKKQVDARFARDMKKHGEYTSYRPYWTSFRALKSHLLKHNEIIELICEEGGKAIDG